MSWWNWVFIVTYAVYVIRAAYWAGWSDRAPPSNYSTNYMNLGNRPIIVGVALVIWSCTLGVIISLSYDLRLASPLPKIDLQPEDEK